MPKGQALLHPIERVTITIPHGMTADIHALDEIDATVASAVADPLHCPARADATGSPRGASRGRCRIDFQVNKSEFLVLKALHSARDWG